MKLFWKKAINKIFKKIYLMTLIISIFFFVSSCGKNPEDALWEKCSHDSTGNLFKEYKTL